MPPDCQAAVEAEERELVAEVGEICAKQRDLWQEERKSNYATDRFIVITDRLRAIQKNKTRMNTLLFLFYIIVHIC